MSKRELFAPKAFERPAGLQWDAPADALTHWADAPPQAAAQDESVISVMEVIGEDSWSGGGFTARKAGALLRNMAGKNITLHINSPGGDMFEGLAVYNLLREHKGEVTVKVLGVAASAASIIAMAGDRIEMGRGAMMMIHNAWGLVVGNRHDFTAASETFAEFDDAMASIYEKRTGQARAAIVKLMDGAGAGDGTFMSADTAIEKGFADAMSDDEDEDSMAAASRAAGARNEALAARRRLDAHLAKAGLPRSERRRLLREAAGTPGAAAPEDAMLRAGDDPAFALAGARALAELQKLAT